MNMLISSPLTEMDSFFDQFLRRQPSKALADWAPRVDIAERRDAYTIKAELPGVSKEDVSVTFENGTLTIKGEKHYKKESDEGKSHRVECAYGQFVRSFSLPDSVSGEQVEASYKDGVLNLTIPKAKEAKTHSIEIKDES